MVNHKCCMAGRLHALDNTLNLTVNNECKADLHISCPICKQTKMLAEAGTQGHQRGNQEIVLYDRCILRLPISVLLGGTPRRSMVEILNRWNWKGVIPGMQRYALCPGLQLTCWGRSSDMRRKSGDRTST